METKPWYKSKGVWTGVAAGLVGAYNSAAPHFQLPPIPDFVYVLLSAGGVYSRATATTQLTTRDNPPQP